MQEELISILLHSKNARFNELESLKAREFLSLLSQNELESLSLKLALDEAKLFKNGFFGLKELVIYAKELIFENASEFALQTRIKNSKLDKIEQKRLLKAFYLKKRFKTLPEWIKR